MFPIQDYRLKINKNKGSPEIVVMKCPRGAIEECLEKVKKASS